MNQPTLFSLTLVDYRNWLADNPNSSCAEEYRKRYNWLRMDGGSGDRTMDYMRHHLRPAQTRMQSFYRDGAAKPKR